VFKFTQERNDLLIMVKMYIITHRLFSLYVLTFQMNKVEDRGKEDWDSVQYHNLYYRILEATVCWWPLANMNYWDLLKWTVQCFNKHHPILNFLYLWALTIIKKHNNFTNMPMSEIVRYFFILQNIPYTFYSLFLPLVLHNRSYPQLSLPHPVSACNTLRFKFV
jgi:hypothetical protein